MESVGNNFTKNKPWADALKRAMARYGDGKVNALNIIADQTVAAAINGDQWAIMEIGNRTDGKAAQSLTVGNEEGQEFKTVSRIELVALSDDSKD